MLWQAVPEPELRHFILCQPPAPTEKNNIELVVMAVVWCGAQDVNILGSRDIDLAEEMYHDLFTDAYYFLLATQLPTRATKDNLAYTLMLTCTK